ncbi:hypothetical protein [Undibacterium rugosum]|uniref:hypothetical protein n=1 Tax=Undibacterium rugosum TaxID=2762291 RepID=UPI001B822488|nr:hypothetical protein [Undibacterium rugosum]MBR7777399.1 hypothetical protein [Undibacterium rugosum]
MFTWFKKLRRIVESHDVELCAAHARIAQLETVLRERTNIAVDVGFRDGNHVIVIGRYKNTDYVQTYSLSDGDISAIIEQLRMMERYGAVKRVDAPPRIRGVFAHEFRM